MSIDAEGGKAGVSKPAGPDSKATGSDAPAPGRALMRLLEGDQAKPARGFTMRPSQGVIAGAVALILGGAFIGGAQVLGGKAQPTVAVAHVDPDAQALRKLGDEIHTLKVGLDALRSGSDNNRQDDAIRAIKRSVDLLKQDLEVAKAASSSAVAQLGTKIDKLDRDPTPKLAEISARLDRLDRNDKEPNPKLAEIAQRLDQLKADNGGKDRLAEITARLDRIERSIAAPAPTGSIAPGAKPAAVTAPVPAAALEPKEPPKVATIDGWSLRDVYDGVALVEGRGRGLREVAPGQFVPGVGEIRSIERRGKSWVVVTSRGLIEADNRW